MTSDQKSEQKLVIRTRLNDKNKSKYQAGYAIPPNHQHPCIHPTEKEWTKKM